MKKKKSVKVFTWILAGVLLVGAIFGITSLFTNTSETSKTLNLTYTVGGLSEDGKYKETTDSIYTSDAFLCQGLKVTPEFDSDISYSLYFYDFDGKFVSSKTSLTDNFNEKLSSDIASCRVCITPNDEDIKWYEVSKYASLLTVEVNKLQLSEDELKKDDSPTEDVSPDDGQVPVEEVKEYLNDFSLSHDFDIYSTGSTVQIFNETLMFGNDAEYKAILKDQDNLSDFELNVKIKVASGYRVNAGVYLFVNDVSSEADNIDAYNVEIESAPDSSTCVVSVYRFENAFSGKVLDAGTFERTEDWCNLKIVVKDSTVTVYLNDSTDSLATFNVDAGSFGGVGLRSHLAPSVFDDFSIKSTQLVMKDN